MSVICVDLSRYQAEFNFAAFKAGGGLGVICKATEGTTVKDKSYNLFRLQAKEAGLAFASYHFFRPSPPVMQAKAYLDFAKPEYGERVVCDWEDDNTGADDVVVFFQAITASRPDLQLTVYSGHTAKEKLTSKNTWLADNTSLWIAQYGSSVSWPTSTWPQWSLWQYTDKGRVPGFPGNVDCNKFNGPNANFLSWMGPASETPPAPPQTQLPTITISSDQPVQLVLGANVTLRST